MASLADHPRGAISRHRPPAPSWSIHEGCLQGRATWPVTSSISPTRFSQGPQARSAACPTHPGPAALIYAGGDRGSPPELREFKLLDALPSIRQPRRHATPTSSPCPACTATAWRRSPDSSACALRVTGRLAPTPRSSTPFDRRSRQIRAPEVPIVRRQRVSSRHDRPANPINQRRVAPGGSRSAPEGR
jgi:hypothetical protein